ncbi:zf-TFIIB domain-containing protein [Noviherbaspirillum humi]|uniref:zf-TFIIB domain-containing protein n=1 Tax=Noviherbaspirillum humi TaxID=1688639 RepID=UPI000B795F1F|nr:zf-TFIIB domain-containing protein [Noviherbaspirillum humi]
MLCPRCEQGDIVKAQIKKNGEEIFVCQECEATWFALKEIGVSPFTDFSAYMEGLGLCPLWDELIVQKLRPG